MCNGQSGRLSKWSCTGIASDSTTPKIGEVPLNYNILYCIPQNNEEECYFRAYPILSQNKDPNFFFFFLKVGGI